MKQITYILLISLGFALISSCTNEEDDIFGMSSAERLNEALSSYKELLQSAPDGWLMEYYAGVEDEKVGGVNYIFHFGKGDTVTAAYELEPSLEVISLYNVIGDQGPVLTFDTYNEIFHFLSEPFGSNDIDGYQGDYELVIMNATPEQITLKGKRYGNKIIMTPFKGKRNEWQSYLEKVTELREETELLSTLTFLKDGLKIGTGSFDGMAYNIKYAPEQDTVEFVNFAIYTTEGLKFYEPFIFDKQQAVNFKWEATSSTFVCIDNGIDFKIKCDLPATYLRYEDYIGTYTAKYTNFNGVTVTASATLTPYVSGVSYRIAGLGLTYLVNYNRTSGSISIPSQYVGAVTDGRPVNLYPWSGSGGSFWATLSGSYNSVLTSKTPVSLIFQSDYPGARGLIVVVGTNPNYSLYNANTCYINLTMIKD